MDILKGFNWGWMSYDTIEGKNHKATITQEIEDRAYEKYFEVEKGDILQLPVDDIYLDGWNMSKKNNWC